jgi:hypothetical protein
VDHAWYLDSGASSHVTSDLGKFFTYSAYRGTEKLAVGNGDQLPIAHIGNDIVNSHKLPARTLILSNMLHVPNIAKNLLSISKFT